MLGTGNALVTKCYNTCYIFENENDYFMVDAGGGNTVLNQLEKVGINWKDVKHIFVTHKHIDHLLGMIWMIRLICQNMAAGKYEGEAYIYGHEEVIEMLETICKMLLQSKQTKYINDRLHLVVVNDGQTKEIIGKKVTFFDIHSTKAKQFGYMMELDENRKLTCCGDETYNEANEKYALKSDYLLHEAFCLYNQADIFHPYEKHHSTVKDACQLAEKLKVKNVVLYHSELPNRWHRAPLRRAGCTDYAAYRCSFPPSRGRGISGNRRSSRQGLRCRGSAGIRSPARRWSASEHLPQSHRSVQ